MKELADDDPRVQYHLDRMNRDDEHRAANPFDCVLRFDHTVMTYFWGRFKTEAAARSAGQSAMRATRREDMPYGKRCIGYLVTDNRDGNTLHEELVKAA